MAGSAGVAGNASIRLRRLCSGLSVASFGMASNQKDTVQCLGSQQMVGIDPGTLGSLSLELQ